jgi:hypothetical protein
VRIWEALEIIAALLGTNPEPRAIELVRSRVHKSYQYMAMTLDECLGLEDSARPTRPVLAADAA